MSKEKFQNGLGKLSQPVLPLVRLVQLLFLTGPFSTVQEVVSELNEPIETCVCRYENPPEALAPYLDLMEGFHLLKEQTALPYIILDESHQPLDPISAIELWTAQNIVTRELEEINSQLCGPCGCALCCTGPDASHNQLFFEIPLTENESKIFPGATVDNDTCRKATPYSEPPITVAGSPFYKAGVAVYHWQSGRSLILPRQTSCPHLLDNKSCSIYPRRPDVCRRPQIFSYILERSPRHDTGGPGSPLPAYLAQRKILAIWDCPYVKQFKQEIATYAELCEMEPIFKENKN